MANFPAKPGARLRPASTGWRDQAGSQDVLLQKMDRGNTAVQRGRATAAGSNLLDTATPRPAPASGFREQRIRKYQRDQEGGNPPARKGRDAGVTAGRA